MDFESINFVAVAAVIVFAVSVIIGGKKGFIKMLFSTFAIFAAIAIALQAGPYASKFLQKTPIYTEISGRIEDKLDAAVENKIEKTTDQINVINSYPLPQSLKNALVENNNSMIYDALGVQQFNAYVAGYMTCLILNGFAFILMFIIALVILKMIEKSLDLISKLPILHGINLVGGLGLGAVQGLIRLWILCIAITMISTTDMGMWICMQIRDNSYLSWVYNHNYLFSVISNLKNVLF